MQLKIKKKVILMMMFIILICQGVAFAEGTAWENTDYTQIDASNVISKLNDLADARIENEEDAELWLEKYKQVQDAGVEYNGKGSEDYWINAYENYSGGASIREALNDVKKKAEQVKSGESSSSSNSEYYKGKWNNWHSVPLDEFSNTTSIDEANTLYNFIINDTIGTENMGKAFLQDYIQKMEALRNSAYFIQLDTQQNGECSKELDGIYREIYNNETLMERLEGTEEWDIINDSPAAQTSAGGNPTGRDTIYTSQPHKNDTGNAGDSLDDVMNDADEFLGLGEVQYGGDLATFSNTIYNILLSIGVIVAVIVGAIIGVKLMASNIDTKVEAKKLLIPYVVGCVVVFGGFAIWKIVVSILQGM